MLAALMVGMAAALSGRVTTALPRYAYRSSQALAGVLMGSHISLAALVAVALPGVRAGTRLRLPAPLVLGPMLTAALANLGGAAHGFAPAGLLLARRDRTHVGRRHRRAAGRPVGAERLAHRHRVRADDRRDHRDGTVRLWDAMSGAPVATLASEAVPACVATTTRAGRWVVAAGFKDGSLRVWNDGALTRTIPPSDGVITAVVFLASSRG